MSKLPLYRAAADVARKHSRVSVVAAAAAAAGVLGAAGFAAGAAPWTEALNNVAMTAQSTSGQHGASLFGVISGTHNGQSASGAQLDSLRSGEGAGGTAAAPGHQSAPHQAVADAAAVHAVKPQPAKAQPAKAKPAKAQAAKQPAKPHAVKPKAAPKPKPAKPKAAHPGPTKPYLMYDSVTPGNIPAGEAAAVYANGAYAASPGQAKGHRSLLWIDINGSNPAADVLDVEPGDATPAGAAQWVKQRLTAKPHSVAIIYTMQSQWQPVKESVATLPGWMKSKVRYWIADPTGVAHVLPGSSATQWYWGSHYDITTANPDFLR